MLGIFVSGCFFAIYRLSLFSCQGTLPHRGGVKFCLYSITVPLCIAAAALVPPARPAGYGQPAFECSVIRFPASPVLCGLSFCRFRWLLPLLPIPKVFYRDLVYFFSWPEKFSICGNHFFSMARASSFFFPALIGLIPSSVASMAFAYLERLTACLNSRVGIFQQGKISPKVARELLSVSFIPASKKEDILHREYPPSLQRSQQP